MTVVTGKVIDILNRTIIPSKVTINAGVITSVEPYDKAEDQLILPGFIDSHVHIESSLLAPAEFARAVSVHGTVATISDPHEIANVLGLDGVRFMLNDAKKSPFKFCFGAPSCVPATIFETSGAKLTSSEIQELFNSDGLTYLSEVMNYPGVISRDPEVMAKITAAQERGLQVDGHAPGLRGADLESYFSAGINTDHECFTLDEALEKANLGIKILIREGSAAKNFNALHHLLKTHPKQCMFCSDDLHPDLLIKGHINLLVKRALKLGYDLFDVLRAACITPVQHYNLSVGLLKISDPADFIICDNLEEFNVQATYIDGNLVSEKGVSKLLYHRADTPNHFIDIHITADELAVPYSSSIRAIGALDGELITEDLTVPRDSPDIHKLVVVNRYQKAKPSVTYITGFGLNSGALASSVAHDSHNIIAVGTTDEEIAAAINTVASAKGGLALVNGSNFQLLPLPIAGLMSPEEAPLVALQYEKLDSAAKELGSQLRAPFMTLSFMALLVIPKLKLSDKGLFDGVQFKFCDE